MKNFVKIFLIILIIFGLIGCGKRFKEMKKAAKELKEIGEKMGETAKDMKDTDDPEEIRKQMEEFISGGKEVEPLTYEKLQDFMPEEILNMSRIDISGEAVELMGVKITEAEAKYNSENGDSRINIKISDIGGMSGVTVMASFAWAMSDFSREDKEGYEKTTTYAGHKAYEEYNYQIRTGKFNVIVVDRFVVNVEGINVEMKQIKDALDQIDIKELETLKDSGVEA